MKNRELSVICFLTLIAVLLSSCATIISKSEYPVKISSNPEGADITVINSSKQNVFKGKTPTIVVLKAGAGFFKGEDYTVIFSKEGYPAHTAQIKRGIDGWYIFGNLVFGGLIGWLIIDPATGAMWTLENLHVDMVPKTDSSYQGLRLVTIDDVPLHLRPKLRRIN